MSSSAQQQQCKSIKPWGNDVICHLSGYCPRRITIVLDKFLLTITLQNCWWWLLVEVPLGQSESLCKQENTYIPHPLPLLVTLLWPLNLCAILYYKDSLIFPRSGTFKPLSTVSIFGTVYPYSVSLTGTSACLCSCLRLYHQISFI